MGHLIRGYTDDIWMLDSEPLLGAEKEELLSSVIQRLAKQADSPARLYASATPDAFLNISANLIEMGDGAAKSTPPVEDNIGTLVTTTINMQTGAVTGGTVNMVGGGAFALPASTLNYYRRLCLSIQSDGSILANFSAENISLSALTNPGPLFAAMTGLPLGYVDLECDNIAGQYRTAGSLSSIIENKVGTYHTVVRFGAGGGGSTVEDQIVDGVTRKAPSQNAVYDALQTEATARSNADSTLQANLNIETTARLNADSTLQANLNIEITARIDADSTLQANIDTEVTARENADSTLQANIDSETTARFDSDSTLQANIDAEATARENADSTLQTNIDSETTARLDADSTLQTQIDNIVGGDTSLRLKNIIGSSLIITAGFLYVETAQAEFYLASDLSYSLAGYTTDGDYYVYLDLDSFGASTPTNLNGRIVYTISSSNIVLLPTNIANISRYAPLGSIQRVSGNWINQQTIARFNYNNVVLGSDSSLEYALPFTTVSDVGTAGQIRAGHVLSSNSFPPALTTQLSYYNMTSLNDASANARNWTDNGTVPYTGTGILGDASGCATFDGATQWLSSTDSFFNPGNADFTCGGWFKPTSYTSGLQTFFGQWSSSGNLSFMVRLTAASQLEVYASTDGTATTYTTINPAITSGWVQVVLRYTSLTRVFDLFVNGLNLGSLTLTSNLNSASTPAFYIGRGAGNNYLAGAVDEFFFSTSLFTDNDIAKTYARKLTHGRLLSPDAQRWYFWREYGGQTRTLDGVIVDIDANEVWWDLSAELSATKVAVKLHNVSSLGSSKVARSKNLELTASQLDGILPISHNLGAVPELSFKVKNLSGDFDYETTLPFVATTTQIKLSGSSLTTLYGASTVCILTYATAPLSQYISPSQFWNTYSTSGNNYVAEQDQVFWDTTAGICTATLPGSPSLGATVRLIDFKGTWGTNKLVVSGNGNNIQGSSNIDLTIDWDACTLVFDGVDNWHLIYG